MEELIDPALVIISDKARESSFNLLNNAKNSMLDNFRSIKWLYYEVEEMKDRIGQIEGQDKSTGKGNMFILEDKLNLIDQRLKNLEKINHTMAKWMFNILNFLNDSISMLNGNLQEKAREEGEVDTEKEEDRIEEDVSTDKVQLDISSQKDKDFISTKDL